MVVDGALPRTSWTPSVATSAGSSAAPSPGREVDAPARARRQVDSVEVGGSATAGTGAVDSPPSAAAGTAPAGAASQERAATGDGQAQAGAWLGQFSRPAGAGRGGASGELRLDVLA